MHSATLRYGGWQVQAHTCTNRTSANLLNSYAEVTEVLDGLRCTDSYMNNTLFLLEGVYGFKHLYGEICKSNCMLGKMYLKFDGNKSGSQTQFCFYVFVQYRQNFKYINFFILVNSDDDQTA